MCTKEQLFSLPGTSEELTIEFSPLTKHLYWSGSDKTERLLTHAGFLSLPSNPGENRCQALIVPILSWIFQNTNLKDFCLSKGMLLQHKEPLQD